MVRPARSRLEMTVFSKAFWKGTAERVVATAAQAAILSIGADQLNVLEGDLAVHAGFAAGGALLALLKALAARWTNDPESPSLVDLSGRHAAP